MMNILSYVIVFSVVLLVPTIRCLERMQDNFNRQYPINNNGYMNHRHQPDEFYTNNNYGPSHFDNVNHRESPGLVLEPPMNTGTRDGSKISNNLRYRGPSSTSDFQTRLKMPADYDSPHIKPRDASKIPRNCTFGICEDVDNYPSDKILALLNRNPSLKQYFSDFLPIPDLNNRGTFADGDTLCDTKVHTKFPKSARNLFNEEKNIVNVDGHQQGVVFETCGTDGGACRYSELFPEGIVSVCKQKYVQRRLMVVNDNNEKLLFDNFEFPSCCICTVRKM